MGVPFGSRLVDWLTAPYSLYLVLQDKTASQQTKLRAGIILAIMVFYIVNPFDLIPDFGPLLGWLDDLLILPLGRLVAERAVPDVDLAAVRVGARARVKKVVIWTAVAMAGLILLGISLFALLLWLLLR